MPSTRGYWSPISPRLWTLFGSGIKGISLSHPARTFPPRSEATLSSSPRAHCDGFLVWLLEPVQPGQRCWRSRLLRWCVQGIDFAVPFFELERLLHHHSPRRVVLVSFLSRTNMCICSALWWRDCHLVVSERNDLGKQQLPFPGHASAVSSIAVQMYYRKHLLRDGMPSAGVSGPSAGPALQSVAHACCPCFGGVCSRLPGACQRGPFDTTKGHRCADSCFCSNRWPGAVLDPEPVGDGPEREKLER